jgi:hypothetical protein
MKIQAQIPMLHNVARKTQRRIPRTQSVDVDEASGLPT